MNPWSALVGLLESAIMSVGETLGGLAMGIFAITFLGRTLLIPLMLPMAVRTRDRMKVVRRIKPEIKALNVKLKAHPHRLERELKALHEANGIKMVDVPGLLSALIQLPVLIALFQAVYSVSEGTPLASGGLLVGLVAAALALAGAKLSGQSEGATWMLWLSGILPIGIALWLGHGIALYLAAFYGASLIQALLMRQPAAAGVHGATLAGEERPETPIS